MLNEKNRNKVRHKPNFLIVGAAKAGTTSAAKYLNEHPDIFIPERKELRFFVRDTLLKVNQNDPSIEKIYNSSILNEHKYFEQFQVNSKKKGEASVHYLYNYKEAIPKIKQKLGDIHIIIFLRNPVDRAISNIKYLHSTHKSTIEDEISKEEERKKKGYNSFWFYLSLGMYSNQVQSYLNNFTKVKIILFEDFIQNPQNELDKLYDFLDVPSYYSKYYPIHNKKLIHKKFIKNLKSSGIIDLCKKLIGKSIFNRIKKKYNSKLAKEIELNPKPETVEYLKNYFKEDIQKLVKLTNIDLSKWKN